MVFSVIHFLKDLELKQSDVTSLVLYKTAKKYYSRYMQNYIDIAQKNDITLLGKGKCQFCGADTIRGVHECVEIYSLGFQVIDYSKEENHF